MAKVGYIKLHYTLSVTSRAPLAKALSLSSNFTLNINIGTILGKFEFGEGPVVNKLVHHRVAVLEVLPALRESGILVHLNPSCCFISFDHLRIRTLISSIHINVLSLFHLHHLQFLFSV